MRILFGSTVPVTLEKFMEGQLSWIASQGHEVHVVSSPGSPLEVIREREHVTVHQLPMERGIAPVRDLIALVRWVRLLRILKPDVVVVGTPKAGLLGGAAARLCGVGRRVYLLRGARYESAQGARRWLLMRMERRSCRSAHCVIAVSPSLADLVVTDRIVSLDRVKCVGAGSSNGVNLQRFHPPDPEERLGARLRLGLGDDQVVIVYLGRLHPDKGLELLEEGLRVLVGDTHRAVTLIVAGGHEGADLDAIHGLEVRILGYVEDVPGLLHAADILVLPTQREGFPNVVLEAAASGLPTATTDATGAVDSVIDGVTGFAVGRRDGLAFGNALRTLVDSEDLRRSMGARARVRVERDFDQRPLWAGMLRAYLGASSSE